MRPRLALALLLVLSPVVPAVWLGGAAVDLLAVFYAGAMVGMLMWVWDAPPEHIERWRRGAEGERRTAKQLRGVERDGWTVRHDIQRGRSNWDHVVVGAAGVFLIDTKNLLGEAEVLPAGLTVRRHEAPEDAWSFSALPGFMRAAAVDLKRVIEASSGHRVWVTPVVVVWPTLDGGVVEQDGVTYVAGPVLRDWLLGRAPRLRDDVAESVGGAVADKATKTR